MGLPNLRRYGRLCPQGPQGRTDEARNLMHATITTDGRAIQARIEPKYKAGSRLAHQIPHCRADWDKTQDPNVFLHWSYPLTLATCFAFRRVFGQELTVL